MEIEKKEDNEGSRAIPLSIRWRIIGFLDAGKKWQEAADFFKISKGTVSKIYKKFIDTGTVDNKPRKGRPKKVRTAGKAEIAMKLEEMHSSARQIAKQMNISQGLVLNIAHEIGYSFKYYEEIPKLTEIHKLQRKNHCQKWKDNDLLNIVFSDESYFHLFRNTLGTWTKETHVYIEKINPNKALMAWGAICFKGKAKLCIKEFGLKLNQEAYIDILDHYLIPFADQNYGEDDWFFLQDNARIHIGKKTKRFLEECEIKLVDHPPYSPDLNPIEFLWKIAKDYVEKIGPKDLDSLKRMIEEAWDQIDLLTIQKSILCVKERMNLVYQNNGEFK